MKDKYNQIREQVNNAYINYIDSIRRERFDILQKQGINLESILAELGIIEGTTLYFICRDKGYGNSQGFYYINKGKLLKISPHKTDIMLCIEEEKGYTILQPLNYRELTISIRDVFTSREECEKHFDRLEFRYQLINKEL